MREDKSTFNSLTGTLMTVDALLSGENPDFDQARKIIEEELKKYGLNLDKDQHETNT